MSEILEKRELAPNIKLLRIFAPEIAAKAMADQFVIVRVDEKGERFPLTLSDWKSREGTITVIFLEVGASTVKLGALEVGDKILDLNGPLGNPSNIKRYGSVAVVCGGLAQQLHTR